MKTTLRTDITVKAICDGFVYNELEGKGLFGLSGKLTIQPEYQRNYKHIVWKYPASPDVAKIKWYPRKEDVFYFTKGKPKYFNEDMARITDIWEINHQEGNEHPAPFPISFAERCILASSEKGDLVYDPFMGSGTTALACKNLNRNFIGSELDKQHYENSLERLNLNGFEKTEAGGDILNFSNGTLFETQK